MGTVQSKLHVLLRGIVNYQWYFDFYISVNTVNHNIKIHEALNTKARDKRIGQERKKVGRSLQQDIPG